MMSTIFRGVSSERDARTGELASMSYLLLCMASLIAPAAGPSPGDTVPNAVSPSIQETQLTVRLGRRLYQATVVGKGSETLIVVTAAHCISAQDVGEPLWLSQGSRGFGGRVEAAAQNPVYRPVASRDPRSKAVRGVLSVDNAIATIRVDPKTDDERRAFLAVKPAELTESQTPGASRQPITVHIIDQYGHEHVVKAGNHLNPKCLAWGHASYQPTPGDSGAGVFLVRDRSEGTSRPLLIGNVALSDDRGGIAPLMSRQIPWIAEAVSGPPPPQPRPEGPPVIPSTDGDPASRSRPHRP
jgi:hypothetical protein